MTQNKNLLGDELHYSNFLETVISVLEGFHSRNSRYLLRILRYYRSEIEHFVVFVPNYAGIYFSAFYFPDELLCFCFFR